MGLFSKKSKAREELEAPPAPPEDISERLPELSDIEYQKAEKPKELVHEVPLNPLFVDVETFREVVEEVNIIKSILKETEDAAERTQNFSDDEETEFRRWKNLIYETHKNLMYCEKILFG